MSALTMPTAGCSRRRAKAIARRENVQRITERIEDREFYENGTIPASATSVSICSCGAKSFARGTDDADYEAMESWDSAHAYCDEYEEADA